MLNILFVFKKHEAIFVNKRMLINSEHKNDNLIKFKFFHTESWDY